MDVVMVTGAAGGIGSACVERFLNDGWQVVAFSDVPPADGVLRRWEDHLDRLRLEIGDVTDASALGDVVARAEHDLGPVVAQVNTAGLFQAEGMLTTESTDPLLMLNVNVVGVLLSMQAVAPGMLSRGSGSIVNLSSVAARGPRPDSAVYAASKAGVISLTRSAAAAWGRRGVRVNAVAPGPVETPMLDEVREIRQRMGMHSPRPEDFPAGRTAVPTEISDVIAFLLSSGASYVNGQCWNVCGGIEMN